MSGGCPFGEAPLGLLLECLELGGHVGVVGRVGRQRPRRSAERVRPHRGADFGHRDTDSRRREHEADLQMVLQVLADVGRVELAGNADGFELTLRSDAGEQEDLR